MECVLSVLLVALSALLLLPTKVNYGNYIEHSGDRGALKAPGFISLVAAVVYFGDAAFTCIEYFAEIKYDDPKQRW